MRITCKYLTEHIPASNLHVSLANHLQVDGKAMVSMNTSTTPAPCEACPPCCRSCAWDRTPAGSALDPKRRLTVVRSPEQYGCVKAGASIVVDEAARRPFMRVGNDLLPLSSRFGGVIKGTGLEADIEGTLTRH